MIIYLSKFIGFALVTERDGSGIFGGIFHYSMIFAFMGSAILAFIYFWRKKSLDFDEEPKLQMMREDSYEEIKKDYHGK